MNPYQVKHNFQINYKKILDDYRHYFSDRQAIVQTNYHPLSDFIVTFNTNNLPHLMGWEKLWIDVVMLNTLLIWLIMAN